MIHEMRVFLCTKRRWVWCSSFKIIVRQFWTAMWRGNYLFGTVPSSSSLFPVLDVVLCWQGFFQGGGGHLPPPWICWQFYFTCKSKDFNDTINGKLCLCESSPRFHQVVSNKRSRTKIFRGSMPPTPPSLPHVLHMDTYLPPPPIIHTISFCTPLHKKLKETWLAFGPSHVAGPED